MLTLAEIQKREGGYLFDKLPNSEYDFLLGACIDAYAVCVRSTQNDNLFTVEPNVSKEFAAQRVMCEAAETLLYHGLDIDGSLASNLTPHGISFFVMENSDDHDFARRPVPVRPQANLQSDDRRGIAVTLVQSYSAFSGIAPRRAAEALTANLH